MLFVELNYTLATEEAERIGVDHIARVTTTEQCANSTVSQHLSAQHSSIKMLHSRVTVILQYIKAMQQGKHSRVTVSACCANCQLWQYTKLDIQDVFVQSCLVLAVHTYIALKHKLKE